MAPLSQKFALPPVSPPSRPPLEPSAWCSRLGAGAADPELALLAFRLWHGCMYRIARRVTTSPWDAEEIVQDVFAKTIKKLRHLREPALAEAFLAKCTVRLAIRRVRKRRWRARRFEELTMVRTGPAEPGEPLALMVEQLLSVLPANERAAVVLRYVEEESLEEVSACLGVSVSTVQRLLARAKERIHRWNEGTGNALLGKGQDR